MHAANPALAIEQATGRSRSYVNQYVLGGLPITKPHLRLQLDILKSEYPKDKIRANNKEIRKRFKTSKTSKQKKIVHNEPALTSFSSRYRTPSLK